MDLLIVVAVVAALAVGAFLGLLLRRQAPRGSPEIAALTGRLSQMAESQTAVHNAIIERLQAQERVVVKTVDERLQRSEEHTSELQSLMRTSSAVFCLKNKNTNPDTSKQRAHC